MAQNATQSEEESRELHLPLYESDYERLSTILHREVNRENLSEEERDLLDHTLQCLEAQ